MVIDVIRRNYAVMRRSRGNAEGISLQQKKIGDASDVCHSKSRRCLGYPRCATKKSPPAPRYIYAAPLSPLFEMVKRKEMNMKRISA